MQDSEIFFLTNENKTLSGIDELKCPAEVYVPSGVTKIDRRAFAACPAKKIFLPDTVMQIGYEAFYGCDALEYVRFPKKIELVEPAIFRECFSLRKVELGDEIAALSENMFECCYSLEEAPFRSGIMELPRNVFSECYSLESLVIPEGVAVIKSGAAAYCKNLSTLVLPSSIKIIEDDAFRNCMSLAHIRFSAENPVFFTDEDSSALFERHDDGTLSLIKVPVNATQIRIPKNVTHSHSEAFQGCDSIEKVFLDCALTDHPLFVALKTEIVDAEFIDETQIKPETKTEVEAKVEAETEIETETQIEVAQKKPRKPRAKKNEISEEKNSEAEAENNSAQMKSDSSGENQEEFQIENPKEKLDFEKTEKTETPAKKEKIKVAKAKDSAKISEGENAAEIDETKTDELAEKKEKPSKKPRKPREKKKTLIIEETLSAEPPEPQIEIEFPVPDTASAEIESESTDAETSTEQIATESEIIEEPLVEEGVIAEASLEQVATESEVAEDSAEQVAVETKIIEEPVMEDVADAEIENESEAESADAPVEQIEIEDEISEEPLAEESVNAEIENETESTESSTKQVAENSTEQIEIEDEVADILGQNIASGETAEEEEDELRGITITIEELDEAMMRGIQEEEESDYKIPEGIFPTDNAEEAVEDLPPPEPRFVNGMISVSSAFEVVDERTLYPDRAEEDLCTLAPSEMEDITTLVVVTEFLDDDGKISASAKDFCVALAKKYDLKRVYFFGALSLDNDEFLYGFGKFALYRNVVFVPNASNFDSLSSEVKSFAEIAELDTTNFHNLKNADVPELELPFKIFASENSQSGKNEIEEMPHEEFADTENECVADEQIADAPPATEEIPLSAQEEVAPQILEEPQEKNSATGKGLLARAQEKDFAAPQGKGLLARAQSALEKF